MHTWTCSFGMLMYVSVTVLSMNGGGCMQHRNTMSKYTIASLSVFTSVVGGLPAEAASEPFCLCCSGGNLQQTYNASLNLISSCTKMHLYTEAASCY